MKSNYKQRLKSDKQICFVSEEHFTKAVDREFTNRYNDIVDDVFPQCLGILMWTELTEYHHTIEYCRKKLNNILYACDMVMTGYGTGIKSDTRNILETLKERGLDVAGIYKEHEKGGKK